MRTILISALGAAAALSLSTHARVPSSLHAAAAPAEILLPVQGLLTDLSGSPTNGATALTFSLYANATSASPLWTETQTIDVDRGLFTIYLGGITPLGADLFRDNPAPYLSMKVGMDGEMDRWPLASAPFSAFANYASDAATLAGKAPADFVEQNASGSISGPMIANAAIDTQQLAFDPATQSELDAHKASTDHNGLYFTKAELQTAGTVNDATNPVEWSKIKGMPAGFADGSDDGNVALDVQCAGCVGTTDLDFDPATQAELDFTIASYYTKSQVDAKLAAQEFKAPAASSDSTCDASRIGTIYFNTATNTFRGCNGSAWVSFSTTP